MVCLGLLSGIVGADQTTEVGRLPQIIIFNRKALRLFTFQAKPSTYLVTGKQLVIYAVKQIGMSFFLIRMPRVG